MSKDDAAFLAFCALIVILFLLGFAIENDFNHRTG
jgi:hypothetical protein